MYSLETIITIFVEFNRAIGFISESNNTSLSAFGRTIAILFYLSTFWNACHACLQYKLQNGWNRTKICSIFNQCIWFLVCPSLWTDSLLYSVCVNFICIASKKYGWNVSHSRKNEKKKQKQKIVDAKHPYESSVQVSHTVFHANHRKILTVIEKIFAGILFLYIKISKCYTSYIYFFFSFFLTSIFVVAKQTKRKTNGA